MFGHKTVAPCLIVTITCIFLFATKTHFRRAAKVKSYSFINTYTALMVLIFGLTYNSYVVMVLEVVDVTLP